MEVPVVPGDWICSRFGCSFMNFAKRTVCRECGKAKKPGLYDDVKPASEIEDDEFLQIEISPEEQDELFFVVEEPGGSKDNLYIFHGNSDLTIETDAVVEPTTEGPTKKKRNKTFKKFQQQCKKQRIERLNDKKKKEEELKVQNETLANSDSTVATSNTAERIFSLLMGEIFETLRKADEDDMSDSFSDISLD
ncbi:uncharacterized protein LOC124206296 [Daphnia pulex]|uniref:uncharacterized protein LOC124206296 n=1 Tax=Daphnia pulex TaxID=6669 RepID=UPI001EE085E3|nr:uncharacterized protein LOC124206288 isoform X1 [Daphnia pulex]XP_046459982.1 uncharacterized protein LOC124206296 [Daphnia pulex]